MPKNNKKETPVKEISEKSIAKKEENVKVITPLKDLVLAYKEASEKIKALDEEYKDAIDPLKQAKTEIGQLIISEFKARGEFSTRIEGATASLSVRKSAVVVDQAQAVEALKAMGLTDYVSEQVNDLFKDGPAKQVAAGVIEIPGVEIKETEYISVRSNEKKDARQVVTGEYKKLN